MCFRLLGTTLNDSPISLVNLIVAKHIIKSCQRLARLGKDHKSADRTVDAVSHATEYIARLGISLLNILTHNLHKRSVARLIALHNLARTLIDDDDVIVFVDYFHLLLFIGGDTGGLPIGCTI